MGCPGPDVPTKAKQAPCVPSSPYSTGPTSCPLPKCSDGLVSAFTAASDTPRIKCEFFYPKAGSPSRSLERSGVSCQLPRALPSVWRLAALCTDQPPRPLPPAFYHSGLSLASSRGRPHSGISLTYSRAPIYRRALSHGRRRSSVATRTE